MNYAISVDWFQYYCLNECNTELIVTTKFKGVFKNAQHYYNTYDVCDCVEFHSMYRSAYTIKYKNRSMLHIYMNPKMSSINPRAMAVKVANRLLYKADWAWYLHDIIEALQIRVMSITRMDICCDFQKFAYKDMLPTEFIQRYLRDKSLAEDEELADIDPNTYETYIREGSNNYCVYGTKSVSALDGSDKITDDTPINVSSVFEYIRFGSRSSGVCTYLYNKSKELRDKKSKPWIRDKWEANGLHECNGDVFRLEFSISAKGMHLKKSDVKRGMKIPSADRARLLCVDDVATQQLLEECFVSYQVKYFTFRLVGNQKYRKDMKQISLFDYEITPTICPCYYNDKLNMGAAERNAALCLQRLQFNMPSLSLGELQTLYQAQSILSHLGVTFRNLKKRDMKEFNTYEKLFENAHLNQEQMKLVRQYVADLISSALLVENSSRVLEAMDYEYATIQMVKEDHDYIISEKLDINQLIY